MSRTYRCLWILLPLWSGLGTGCAQTAWQSAYTEEQATLPRARLDSPSVPPVPVTPPAPASCDRPLPINLPTALKLANTRPIDIALATERVRVAAAQLERSNVLWLPTVYVGGDYFRHDGQIQPLQDVIGFSRSSVTLGVGPYAVFAITDAIFSPLAERQVVRARQAGVQAATNDTFLAVAEAYFNVQQARGELAGAEDTARRAAEVVRRTKELAEGLAPPVEASRARAELARREQSVDAARERWRTASAELMRVLRLDAPAVAEPLEPPHLSVTLVGLDQPVDELIPVALTNRPELAAQQALVQATLQRLRQERLRPLIPSVLLRGASTPVPGTLAGGVFGGGPNDFIGNFGARADFDIQLLWQFENLGLGNRARVEERRAENRLSVLELFGIQDRVAAEVAQAYAQAQSGASRMTKAATGLKEAVDTMEKSLEGLGQTRRAGNLLILVNRPQEAVAAVQSLAQAYNDYYGAVADYNRAQFRLYRALGQPAQTLLAQDAACPVPGATSATPQQEPPTAAPPAH